MSEQKTNAQRKQEAIEKAQRAVAEAQHGTPQQKDQANEELKRAQQMPDN